MHLGQLVIGGVLHALLARRIPGSVENIAVGIATGLTHPFASQ